MTGHIIAIGCVLLAVIFASAALGQQKVAAPTAAQSVEFPVVMLQKVAGGKTPVGQKVQARLALATLAGGVVVPEGAVLSGEVTESVGKSATAPSRLAVRVESAHWKNGSLPVKLYLTAWYYPVVTPNQDPSFGQPDATKGSTLRTGGAFPGGAKNPNSRPFPDAAAQGDMRPALSIAQHRAWMKNVKVTRNGDGDIILTSEHSNLKLDTETIYVLAADGLLPSK